MTPRHRGGGPAANKIAVRSTREERRILARQKRAWHIYVTEGKTLDQIAERLGVSGKTIWYDIQAQRERMYADMGKYAEVVVARQLERLETLRAAHMRQAKRKDRPSATAAGVVLDTMRHEAKLLGLYPERKQGYSLDQVMSILRNYTGIVMDALRSVEEGRVPLPAARGLIAQGLRSQLGPVGRQVIDVLPEEESSAS